MPWKINPFTGEPSYYEKGLPPPTIPGAILVTNSDGDNYEWNYPNEAVGDRVISNPPVGCLRVTNIYVNPSTNKAIVQYSNIEGESASGIQSAPPSGFCKVINIYVDPNTGKTVIDWDNIPET